MARLNVHAWILSLIKTATPRTLMSQFFPFSSSPSLIATASKRPGHMAKRAEQVKLERYPHVNLVPFFLETAGRPGYHAKQFVSNLMKDSGNHLVASETPGQPSRVSFTAPSPNNNSQLQPRDAFCSPHPQFHFPAALRFWMLVPFMRERPLCRSLSTPKCS